MFDCGMGGDDFWEEGTFGCEVEGQCGGGE